MLKKAQTATIILPGLPQPPIIYGEVCANGADFPVDDWCLLFLSFRRGNLAGCEQYVFAKQALPSMRCKDIQKSSIIATFSFMLMCFKMKFA